MARTINLTRQKQPDFLPTKAAGQELARRNAASRAVGWIAVSARSAQSHVNARLAGPMTAIATGETNPSKKQVVGAAVLGAAALGVAVALGHPPEVKVESVAATIGGVNLEDPTLPSPQAIDAHEHHDADDAAHAAGLDWNS